MNLWDWSWGRERERLHKRWQAPIEGCVTDALQSRFRVTERDSGDLCLREERRRERTASRTSTWPPLKSHNACRRRSLQTQTHVYPLSSSSASSSAPQARTLQQDKWSPCTDAPDASHRGGVGFIASGSRFGGRVVSQTDEFYASFSHRTSLDGSVSSSTRLPSS